MFTLFPSDVSWQVYSVPSLNGVPVDWTPIASQMGGATTATELTRNCIARPASNCVGFLISDAYGDGLNTADDPNGFYAFHYMGNEIYYGDGRFTTDEWITVCL